MSSGLFLEKVCQIARFPFRKCGNFRFVANMKAINIQCLNYLVFTYLFISNDEDSFVSPGKTSGSGSRDGPVGPEGALSLPGLTHFLSPFSQSFEVQLTCECTGFKCAVDKCAHVCTTLSALRPSPLCPFLRALKLLGKLDFVEDQALAGKEFDL